MHVAQVLLARAEVSRRINKYSKCDGKVVNADDGEQLGEHRIRVSVKQDDKKDLYVENKKVLEELAKTQNGTRPRPKKDYGPFYRGVGCNFLERARELFDEERYKLVLPRELAQFQQQEDADSDEDEEDADEEEDDEFTYVWPHGTKPDIDLKKFPQAAEDFFIEQRRSLRMERDASATSATRPRRS